MRICKTPPEDTTMISEKTFKLREHAATRLLSDLECYTFITPTDNAEEVFTKPPNKKIWNKFVKRFGRETMGQAYRYWLSYSR